MKARDVFLIMVSHAGGTISGKTFIQKQGFFLDLFLGLNLNYGPHYYGPYSPELEAAIGQCKALGFVDEKIREYGEPRKGYFEVKRYDYTLTPDGQKVVEALRLREPENVSKIEACLEKLRKAGELDYVQLSIAAKAVYILNTEHKAMDPAEIAKAAQRFNWDIDQSAVEKAIEFLKKLELVSLNAS